MDLILLVLALALIGYVVYLIITQIAMPDSFRAAIQVLVLVIVVLYLLRRFGHLVPNVLE